MIVKELIEKLKEMPQDATVVTSCDFGNATVKRIVYKKNLDDVIVGDYLSNSENLENVVFVDVDSKD